MKKEINLNILSPFHRGSEILPHLPMVMPLAKVTIKPSSLLLGEKIQDLQVSTQLSSRYKITQKKSFFSSRILSFVTDLGVRILIKTLCQYFVGIIWLI